MKREGDHGENEIVAEDLPARGREGLGEPQCAHGAILAWPFEQVLRGEGGAIGNDVEFRCAEVQALWLSAFAESDLDQSPLECGELLPAGDVDHRVDVPGDAPATPA